MSFRIFCSILVFISLRSQADETSWYPADMGRGKAKYILVPTDVCKTADVAEKVRQVCTPQRLPVDFKDYRVQQTSDIGVFELTYKNSDESDDFELLCYRCTLEKGAVGKCGRYKNVWGDRNWTVNCPKPKEK